MNLLIDLQYFACVDSIINSCNYSNIYLPLYKKAPKSSFANRCIVAGSNGLINLSVPLLEGRNQKMLYKETRISNHERWQMRHWRTIMSCYRRTPYFDFYEDQVSRFFEKDYEFLADLNMEIMTWLMKTLKFPGQIHFLTHEKDLPAETEDISWKWLPKNYRENAGAFTYIQPFQSIIGFQPNLSILDALFCAGPEFIREAAQA